VHSLRDPNGGFDVFFFSNLFFFLCFFFASIYRALFPFPALNVRSCCDFPQVHHQFFYVSFCSRPTYPPLRCWVLCGRTPSLFGSRERGLFLSSRTRGGKLLCLGLPLLPVLMFFPLVSRPTSFFPVIGQSDRCRTL